ncbi:hypothetical protein BUALT_Bualt18G0106800 [Buddleja alternifolia]|uniref:Uncharacterized protein n=1 Tax=Buddleja alternifolia TaxID=168488 RepID=A0AAV6WAA4_9LAMI|nr:hypothetical protein BUALT_Bualt18G0106800 [Buddleja alternifolia]
MGRAPCCEKNGLKRGPWTQEEDQKLIDYIHKNGSGNWRNLPKNAGLQRCGKSCRLRWTNYLRPDIKRGRFSFEEEETIIQLHSILGNKWSAIAARLPGRTDNEIKNYWNTHIRKKLLRMGIDPVTHNPRLDLLDFSRILNSSMYANSNSQMNFSRLLGMQSLINPELLRLASSLFSSQRQNQDYLMQNQVISDNHQTLNPIPTSLIQNCPIQTQFQNLDIPIPNHDYQAHQLMMQYDDVQQFSQNVSGFGLQDYMPELQDYMPETKCVYYESGQNVVDPTPSPETNSTFQSNSSNNFSLSTEDERESYCSNLLKFDVSDILDVNDFL